MQKDTITNICSPQEALRRLQEGNARFLAGAAAAPVTLARRRELVQEGQHPYACIVCCSDSRVQPEAIFHAGLGELFVIRTAGNTISASERATVAYACSHLHVPLVVIMGHTHCGAIEAAVSEHVDEDVEPIVGSIRAVLGAEKDPRKCEIINARAWADKAWHTGSLASAVEAGEKLIMSALYDTETGHVRFHNMLEEA